MTKYFHIVQVHPIVQGILQTHKVKAEREFNTKESAEAYVAAYNKNFDAGIREHKAVYLGCVNDDTGELV
jgi:N-acetyl-gamma-glutamylphosphate reductase